MTRADLPAFERLFFRVFRDEKCAPDPLFNAFIQKYFFESPAYAPALGSFVQEDRAGKIVAIMGVVPMPLIACGREITARLGSAFMADPEAPPGVAGRITTQLIARRQDFVFSNNGAAITAQATRAGGGMVIPLQSLDWHRRFRPVASLVNTLLSPPSRRTSRWAPLARALARPFDAMLRRLWPKLRAAPVSGVSLRLIDRETLLREAPVMVARFAVRPRWSREDLGWLLDLAALKQANGPLHLMGAYDAGGVLIGIALYYARPGDAVEILNLLCLPHQEQALLGSLLHHLDRAGQISVRGEAQPFLMPALFLQRGISYKFRGNFCVLTRHADVAQAVQQGDFYAGGLMGESWSRLVTDFW